MGDLHEFRSFLESLDDKELPAVESALLIAPDKVFELLEIPLRELWEARRQGTFLPTYKTYQKLITPGQSNWSRSSLDKVMRYASMSQYSIQFLTLQRDQGYLVPSLTAWLGLLEQGQLMSPIALDHWRDALCELAVLSGPVLHSAPPGYGRYKLYSSATIIVELGCPVVREELLSLLEDQAPGLSLEENPLLHRLLIADGISTLLRLAAWLMADWQVSHWDIQEREGTQDVIHAKWVIPRYCPSSATWSCPMEDALAGLAKMAGWTGRPKPVTFLGKLWAAGDGLPEGSRIRLLRNWLQLRPGRPSFEMLRRLVQMCMNQRAKNAGEAIGDWESDYRLSACVFRFAETLSRVVRFLHAQGYPTELIASIMSVYETEYRAARTVLRKPITDQT